MYNEYPKNVITRLRSESENFCLSSDTCAVLCEAADLIEQQMRCMGEYLSCLEIRAIIENVALPS